MIRPLKFNEQFEATLQQMWILIQQLEEINTQFDLFLQRFTTSKPSTMQPSQPLDECSNQPAAIQKNQLTIHLY